MENLIIQKFTIDKNFQDVCKKINMISNLKNRRKEY